MGEEQKVEEDGDAEREAYQSGITKPKRCERAMENLKCRRRLRSFASEGEGERVSGLGWLAGALDLTCGTFRSFVVP